MPTTLNIQQRNTLHVLGYLYFRLGSMDKAKNVFATLVVLAPKDAPYRLAHASLAAIDLEDNNGRDALKHLHIAMEGATLSSREASFYLMRARALWQEGRHDESRMAIKEYLYLNSGKVGL